MFFYPLRYRIYAMVKTLMLTDNGGIGKVDWWKRNWKCYGSRKWKWKINEMKGLAKIEKLIKDQNGKMENNGKVMELKNENRDEKNDKRAYGNCYQCSATQLMLYGFGCRKLLKDKRK